MPTEISIPRLGWSMEEGIFSKWLKNSGDKVRESEPLFTLESDKAAHDVEFMSSGILYIPPDGPKSGDVVKVGQVIGYFLAENEAPPASGTPAAASGPAAVAAPAAPAAAPASAVPVPAATPDPAPEPAKAAAVSPRARRKAEELGLATGAITGTGRTGRVREADVLRAAAEKPAARSASAAGSQPPSVMRRNIAERTARSFATIPHFYLRAEVDVTGLIAMRENLLEVIEHECGVRITVTDFLLRAQALALRDFPAANAVWQDAGILRYADADVGLVVGLDDGLLIPVIRGAQNLSLVALARERSRLVAAARAGKCSADMLAGGAASLSNLGTTRIDEFAAVVAPHQSTMLAVGRAMPRPVVVLGELAVRTTIRLCLSVDHRVLDGGPAAEFLGRIVDLLETPKSLVEA